MSKNTQAAKTEEPKVEPVVQAPSDAPESAPLAETVKMFDAVESEAIAKLADPDEQGEEQLVEVRVLTLCQLGVANDVAEVPKGSLPGLKSLGYVDDHPDAVAFAKSLKVPKA